MTGVVVTGAVPEMVAVMTGDIVRSSRMSSSELDGVFATLDTACGEIRGWPEIGGLLGPERHRGDGWQAALWPPELALRAAMYLFARFRAEENRPRTRIGLGIGAVDHLDLDSPGASTGEAFLLSGGALDDLRSGRVLEVRGPQPVQFLGVVAALCGSIAAGWTARQSEVLAEALAPDAPSQSAIGERLGISQPSVADHLSAAHWAGIQAALEGFEELWKAEGG